MEETRETRKATGYKVPRALNSMGSHSIGGNHQTKQESVEEHKPALPDAARKKAESRSVLEGPGAAWISLGLALVAAISVLSYGGRYGVSRYFMQAWVGVLAPITWWRYGWPPVSRLTTAILVILLFVPLAQVVPLWEGLVAVVSPNRAAIARDVLSPTVGPSKFITLSVNPHATQLATLQLICYFLVFLLSYQVYVTRRRQPFLIPTLIALGSFEAVLGIVRYLVGLAPKARGTYSNHNHYAGLLEMVLPFVLAGILLRLLGGTIRSRTRWAQVLASSVTGRFLLEIVLFAVLFVALVFSQSRMGIAAGIVGLLVEMVLSFLQTRRRSALAIALVVFALAGAYSVWIGLSPVLERFEQARRGFEEGRLEGRVDVWSDTLALIRDFAWLGTGLGTYHWSSIRYQTYGHDARYDHAHNDYLEFAADIGIPAAVLLFASLWVLVVKVACRSLVMERTNDRIMAAGCAGSMACLLTHALADFNFQIPANAFLFSWIAGTAAGILTPGRFASGSVPLVSPRELPEPTS